MVDSTSKSEQRRLRLVKIVMVYAPAYGFMVIGYSTLASSFNNYRIDTTYLTNYGFAILIGISSVCFSWARNLEPSKEPEMRRSVSTCAELALNTAIIFLLASALKYSQIHMASTFLTKNISYVLYATIELVLMLIYSLCFAVSIFHCFNIVKDLLLILYNRLYLDRKY